MILGIEKSPVKEVETEIENERSHVNALMTEHVVVTIERIDTTEIGIGLGIETETGKGKETVDVIGIEIAVAIGNVVGIVTGTGNVIGTEIMIVIVKGTEIMKLGTLIEDARMIGSLIMIVLKLNMRGIDMVKGSGIMNLRMIVVGMINLSMDIGMQTLIMMLSSMTTMSIKDEASMIMGMTALTTTINILIMIEWRMTTALNAQHLNLVTVRKIVMWTMNIIALIGPILGSMIISALNVVFLN